MQPFYAKIKYYAIYLKKGVFVWGVGGGIYGLHFPGSIANWMLVSS